MRVFHAELGGAVFHVHVEFLEGIGVEQKFDALAGRQLAAGVLGLGTLLSATHSAPLKYQAAIASCGNQCEFAKLQISILQNILTSDRNPCATLST
jgi:hypothetical protein